MDSDSSLFSLWRRYARRSPRVVRKGAAVTGKDDPLHGHVAAVEVRDDLPNGRGLALARDVQPGEVVLTLPSTLLLNVKTAAPFFENAKSALPAPRRGAWSGYHGTPSAVVSDLAEATTLPLPLTSMQVLSVLLASTAIYQSQRERLDSSSWSQNQRDILEDLCVFCQSLPQSFGSHPLMWTLWSQEGGAASTAPFTARYRTLLSCLPVRTQREVFKMAERFEADWAVCSRIFSERRDLLPFFLAASSEQKPSKEQYAHSWLSISTRSVYLPLNLQPHEDNFTLAPLLDMANHTSASPRIYQISNGGTCGQTVLVARPGAGGLEMRAPSKEVRQEGGLRDGAALRQGDEVHIQYGAREDGLLLAEYGFHLSLSALATAEQGAGAAAWQGNPYACVDLTLFAQDFLAGFPEQERTWKEEALQEAGYWGDWTIHPHPKPGLNWRTIMALRLIVMGRYEADSAEKHDGSHQPHVADSDAHRKRRRKELGSASTTSNLLCQVVTEEMASDDLRRWRLVLNGSSPLVSQENEKAAQGHLDRLCHSAYGDAASRLDELDRSLRGVALADDGDYEFSTKLVRSLLLSQVHIARRVAEAVKEGGLDC